MKKYIGGYSIIDLASTTIYADALGALNQDKPVLVYDTPECYYADTISLDGTNVVITKGGKTITIANDNTITNVGDIQPHLYRYDFEIQIDGGEGDSLDACFSLITNISDLDFEFGTKLTNDVLNRLPLYKGLPIGDDSNQNAYVFWEFDNVDFIVYGSTNSSIQYTRNEDIDTIRTINKIQLI